MLIKNRPDGSPAKVPGFTKIVPILMATRTESAIYMDQEFLVDDTLSFIEKWNESLPEGRRKLTLMQVFLNGFGRTVAMRPALNRFVSNYRHYQRNNISVSFISKKKLTDDGEEVNVTLPLEPFDTIEDVNERFTRYVERAKSDSGNKSDADVRLLEKLPVFVLRFLFGFIKFLDRHNWINKNLLKIIPFYCTAFLTNVGSLKIEAPFHHNFEVGNAGIFIALGKIRKALYFDENHEVKERTVVKITYTFDDRIADGIYCARAMFLLKEFVENPEKLVDKPVINPKYLKELNLTEKGRKLWAM